MQDRRVNDEVRAGLPGPHHARAGLAVVAGNPMYALPSLINGLAREHSRKPDEFYRARSKQHRAMRRADLFSRETREGFEAWGNEAESSINAQLGTSLRRTLLPPQTNRQLMLQSHASPAKTSSTYKRHAAAYSRRLSSRASPSSRVKRAIKVIKSGKKDEI